MRAKFLVPQPFPRVELEVAFNHVAREINKSFRVRIPTDVLDENRFRPHARLFASISQIQHGHLVLGVVLDAAEMDRATGETSPRLDEPLRVVERQELMHV